MKKENYAEWIREGLAKNNMKQSDLARITGLSRSTINGYISGRRKDISAPVLTAIANAFGENIIYVETPDPAVDKDSPEFDKTEWEAAMKDVLKNRRHSRIIALYDGLNEEGQRFVYKFIRVLYDSSEYRKQS